jgi:hypothetical protein
MTRKQIIPILFIFVLINALLLFGNAYFSEPAFLKFKFVMVVNLMLFGMSIFNFIRLKKMDANNPHAMVRSVMVGTLLKMLIFAGAALAYATQTKIPVGMSTLLVSMGLYLIYTWLEIRWTQIKKS